LAKALEAEASQPEYGVKKKKKKGKITKKTGQEKEAILLKGIWPQVTESGRS
jgi:hypothetical protein